MKMNQEELKAMLTDMTKEQLAAAGKEWTAAIEDKVKGYIEDTLKEKIKAKEILMDDEDGDERKDKRAGFKTFSEFAIAVKNAEISKGRKIDKRLEELEQKAAGTSVREADAEYGGYLIPEEFRNNLLEIAVNQSNIMGLGMTVPMATNAINIPYVAGTDRSAGLLHGGVQFLWLDEEGLKSETRPKFGKIQLRLKKLAGLCYASDEILEDSPITLEPLLTRMFSEALTWTLDNVFLNGSGAGKPLGILNCPALISVDKEAGQGADTILYENILNMYMRQWNKSNAIWMVNEDTFVQLASMSLAVGTGGVPVWMPAGGASGKPYDTLMGKPMMFSEHCKTVGDKGDIYLVDWSQYLIGQKAGADAGMKFASSIHLKFDYDQTCFRFVFRIDGQPWWPAPLTPLYSSKTLSPFVTLSERA